MHTCSRCETGRTGSSLSTSAISPSRTHSAASLPRLGSLFSGFKPQMCRGQALVIRRSIVTCRFHLLHTLNTTADVMQLF